MKKVVLLLAAFLGGCATVPITQGQADTAMETGRAVLTTELAYARLPRCVAGKSWSEADPCSTLAGVKALDGLSKIVVADINQLQSNTVAGIADYNEVALLLVAIRNLQEAIGVLE